MQALFSIDGVSYNVGVESLKRGAEVTDGNNAGTMLSGRRTRDLLGVYYNYTLVLSTDLIGTAEYNALYEVLTAAQESHTVVMPYGNGTITFDAAIDSVSDELLLAGKENLWSNLSFTFTAMQPYRR